MKVRKLEWSIITNVGGGYCALVNEFQTSYAIWFSDGKTLTGDPDNNHKEHTSKEDAMEWCQKDFELRANQLFE